MMLCLQNEGNRPKRVYGLVVLPRVSAVKRGWLWSATLSRGSSFESDVVRDMWNPVGEERENAGGNAAVALCEVWIVGVASAA